MTQRPSICVITPTIGRSTLRRAIESGEGLSKNDEWFVMADGPLPADVPMWLAGIKLACSINFIESATKTGDYGNALRDHAMSLSDKDYFVFLDDDDIFAPNAIQIIKREIAAHYPRPIIFKMINGNGETLWRTREVTPGNVGASMFVCPNDPNRLGVWANGGAHRSDFDFIEQTLKFYGPGWRQNLHWSGDVIVHCRPEEWR